MAMRGRHASKGSKVSTVRTTSPVCQ